MLETIYNYEQMTPDLATSGQPTAEQFQSIAAAGYQTVINLALPSSDRAIPEEGSLVTGLGMRYIHIPVEFDRPTAADLTTFCGFLEALEGSKVWVHCVVNARVSAFVYKYLTGVRGVPEEAATSSVLQRWRPSMDDTWRAFLDLDPRAQ